MMILKTFLEGERTNKAYKLSHVCSEINSLPLETLGLCGGEKETPIFPIDIKSYFQRIFMKFGH